MLKNKKSWYDLNREVVLERAKEYYKKKRDDKIKKVTQWNKDNKDKRKIYNKRYREKQKKFVENYIEERKANKKQED